LNPPALIMSYHGRCPEAIGATVLACSRGHGAARSRRVVRGWQERATLMGRARRRKGPPA